jgi:hypothetical protein
MRNAYKMLIAKPEVKRPLGRPKCRWEGNIKINVEKTGKRRKRQEAGEDHIMKSFITCTLHQMLFGRSS